MIINAESYSKHIYSVEFTTRGYDSIINELRPGPDWELASLTKDMYNGYCTLTFTRFPERVEDR